MSSSKKLIRSINSDGTCAPSAFEGVVSPIDCIAFVDSSVEEAQRIMSHGPLPTNVRKGLWTLGQTSLEISEDGNDYQLAWLQDSVIVEQSSMPLDITLVPKLAMAILVRFRSLYEHTINEGK